jgi:hypothetical protein
LFYIALEDTFQGVSIGIKEILKRKELEIEQLNDQVSDYIL